MNCFSSRTNMDNLQHLIESTYRIAGGVDNSVVYVIKTIS